MMYRRYLVSLLIGASLPLAAQVVAVPAQRTLRTAKAEVVSLAVAPKGDMLLVGTNKGAELYDLTSGKKVQSFGYAEDGASTAYYVAFNENGEYVVLIGHSGKRVVYDVKTGKPEPTLSKHRWVPDPRAVKAMGLDMSNSTFDRFYQQGALAVNGLQARSVKDGAVELVNTDGKVVQRIEVPENKDQHHRAPIMQWEQQLFIGQDDGRVLIYDVL